MAIFIVGTFLVFLGGFILGIELNEHFARKRHEKMNTGHLANINTALWSIMNSGLRVRQLKKKKKIPLWGVLNEKPQAVSVRDTLPIRPKIKVELDLMKRAGLAEHGNEL